MSFTAAFVEYLINGCTSLLWILLLLPIDKRPPDSVPILLFPVLYAIGMLIDVASYYMLRWLQQLAWKSVKDPPKPTLPPYWSPSIAIIMRNADVGRELLIRASRVRTARGSFLNFVLLTIMLLFRPVPAWFPVPKGTVFAISICFTLLSGAACWRFERLVESFKRRAYIQTLHYLTNQQ